MELNTTSIGTEGPLVAFCHGVFGQGKNWTTIARSLATGDPDHPHRALLIDMPNHGRSPWTDTLDYPTMADQVAETLVAQGAAERPLALVGHSMGGKIAMHLTLRHPELIERLCVVDISPVDYGPMRAFHGYVAALQSLELDTLTSRSQAEEHLARREIDPGVRSFLLQNLRRESEGDTVRWRWQPNLELIGEQMQSLGGWSEPDQEPWWGPVLWVAGGESDYVSSEYAPAMRALFPKVRQITIKGAAHWVHADQPQIFTQILRQFLDA